MTSDPLVEAIRSAPCTRVALKHPECVAAAVRTWIEGELLVEQARYADDEVWVDAISAARARLVGNPWDLDVEPEGEQ